MTETKTNRPLLFFGGYSGSGKTTFLIPILKGLGFTILSSSEILHNVTDRIAKELLGARDYDSYDRNLILSGSIETKTISSKAYINDYCDSYHETINLMSNFYEKKSFDIPETHSRDFCIQVAEKCLVPVFSRSVFSHVIADRILKAPEENIAVEVFKTEEYDLLLNRLKGVYCAGDTLQDITTIHYRKNLSFNLRRDSESPEVDTRELIPSVENIWNNGTYQDLETKVLNFLS